MTRDETLLFEQNPVLCPIVKELEALFNNKEVLTAFNQAIANVKNYPADPPLEPKENLWRGKDYKAFCHYFNNWYDFLATPSTGLGFIEPF
ncbi:MAG: hypothetical protein VSS75_026445, partial [Candidatus Parabeggiatoa sp.]|nr:hypothetical protein [Candidatus Parabeggiatoa sp.]